MSFQRRSLIIGSLAASLFFSGCGKHKDHDETKEHQHGESEHGAEGEEGGSTATFKEGRGLQFAPEVVAALGVRTAEAEERSLARNLNLMAQVFASGNKPRAVAFVSPAQAEGLKPGLKATVQQPANTATAELVAVSRIAEKAAGQVELIFALPAALPATAVGDTLTLSLTLAADSPALTVPRSALLDSATGTFVYVVNGAFYLRTPVKVGASNTEFIEITDGLYAGDVVVTEPVNQLWLSELRLTKGGGHSH